MVKALNAREEMALGKAQNHYARENMYIRINAQRSILAILQSSPKYWISLENMEKFGKGWKRLESLEKRVRSLKYRWIWLDFLDMFWISLIDIMDIILDIDRTS